MVKHEPGPRRLEQDEPVAVLLRVEVSFFVKDPEEEIQKYHFAGEFYEQEELELIRRYYKKDTRFADIGANIGNHAVYAEKVLRAPEVVVFEPNPVAVDYLKLNLSLNNCRRVQTQFLGLPVSDRMGQPMEITLSPGNNIGNTMFGPADHGAFRTITGDFALLQAPVGFIKIDAEEMEFEILDGLRATLDLWRPTVFVEILDEREPELVDWAGRHRYEVAESLKRYLLATNYVLVPR